MKQKPSLTYLSHEVCTFLGRIVRPTRNLAHASLKTAVHISQTTGIKKKSGFLKKGLSIFAMQSVTCGFLFLRFQAELPIQIILSMLFKQHVLDLEVKPTAM